MRVLICGGRDYENREEFFWQVSHIINPNENHTIISGGARGADTLAIDYAETYNLNLEVFMADWNLHGRAAGPIRNKQMLDEGKPDLVIAFPGGRGTGHMTEIARNAGVEVREVR